AGDIIATGDRNFLRALQQASQALTVLDPTCGSGAFLLAALTVLEELQRACRQRAEPGCSLFDVRQDILLCNLQGVDLMGEALELCKMRLFLKLFAALEPGQDCAPLRNLDHPLRNANVLTGEGVDFPEIMKAGGFDGIVGNPPYLPASRVQDEHSV